MLLREGGLALVKQRLRTKKLVQYIKTKIYNFPYYYSNTFPDFRSNSSLTYEVWNIITVTTSSPGLFPPHPFFEGKALGTRLLQ